MGKVKTPKGKGKKPKPPKQGSGNGDTVLTAVTELGLEILTLSEAAELLRVSVDGLKVDAENGNVPARFIAGEWRFMKHALFNWLRYPPHQPYPLSAVGPTVELPGRILKAMPREPSTPNARQLSAIGSMADDDTLPELADDIHRRRAEGS